MNAGHRNSNAHPVRQPLLRHLKQRLFSFASCDLGNVPQGERVTDADPVGPLAGAGTIAPVRNLLPVNGERK